MKNFLLAAVVVFGLAGCDGIDAVKEGFSHSQAVSTSLEKSLGLKSFVGFNWNNGSLTSVNVTFDGIPKDKQLAEIADVAKQAIRAEFKQVPGKIIISFAVAP